MSHPRTMYRQILVLTLVAGAAVSADAAQTILYPTEESPSFSITAPDKWTLVPAEAEGDYFTLQGPTGAVLSFRTVEGSENGMQNAIAESMAYLEQAYGNVQLDEPADHEVNGLEGFYATGSGKDKGDGTVVVFGMAWYALADGTIGEIWFEAENTDKAGAEAAGKILDTFRAH